MKVNVITALSRGIIDQANGTYIGKDDKGREMTIPISDAIKRGLVIAEESRTTATVQRDGKTPRYVQETRTFSVRGVVDPQTGEEMSVVNAMKRGYLDQKKGLFMNPKAGESMTIPEAVGRGFVLADVVSTTDQSQIPASSEIMTSREVRVYLVIKFFLSSLFLFSFIFYIGQVRL